MTATCPGGTSQVKPGVNDVLIYAAGGATVVAIPPSFRWILPLIPLLGNVVYHTQIFCAADPPPVPTFTAAEYTAFLNLTFDANYWSFMTKLKAAVDNAVWWSICECVGVATPAEPALPGPPSTTTYVPVTSTPEACATKTQGPEHYTGAGQGLLEGFLAWDGVGRVDTPTCLCNATGIHLQFTNSVVSGGGFPVDIQIRTFTRPSSTSVLRQTYTVPPGGFLDVMFTNLGPNDYMMSLSTQSQAGTGESVVSGTYSVFCDGDLPGVPQQACCPPDTTMLAMLDHLIKQVDLIQRQAVPFSYVPGTTHSGLTGAGELSVSGILGLVASLTTTPTSIGTEAGNPPTTFHAGWLNVGTADGWQNRQFITTNPMVWLPRDMGAMTRVGYSLSPGVVATVQEIVREP